MELENLSCNINIKIHYKNKKFIIKKNNVIIYDAQSGVAAGLLMTLNECGNKVIQTDKNSQMPSRVSSDAQALYKQRIEIMKSQPGIFSKVLSGLFGGGKSRDDVSVKQKIAEDEGIKISTDELEKFIGRGLNDFIDEILKEREQL